MSYRIALPRRVPLAAWRDAARRLASHGIPPDEVEWASGAAMPGLFDARPLPEAPGLRPLAVPQAFVTLAGSVIWHKAPERFDLLYRALWRLTAQDGAPLSTADPLGRRLDLLARSVRRDIHKMHAFVRFREVHASGPRRLFAAWFEPEHDTLEPGAPFFAKRFADMDWLIATPTLSARFEDGRLRFESGGTRPDLPEDASEALWQTYFANTFNPARIKLDAMRAEMPKKYWKNLPETRLIPAMLAEAEARVARMHAAGAAPARPGAAAVSTRYREAMPQDTGALPQTLADARAAALHCRRCALCDAATGTVWGEGPPDASLMIVGEQPGDREDLEGRPFVGPAGKLLRDTMQEAGITEAQTYLTNAVKHFKFAPRGKMRLHQNPNRGEIQHCRWWLGLELRFVRPRVTLALGATAAFALTGDDAPLAARRGGIEAGLHGGPVLVAWHPAHVLRLKDGSAQRTARAELLDDLRMARGLAFGGIDSPRSFASPAAFGNLRQKAGVDILPGNPT